MNNLTQISIDTTVGYDIGSKLWASTQKSLPGVVVEGYVVNVVVDCFCVVLLSVVCFLVVSFNGVFVLLKPLDCRCWSVDPSVCEGLVTGSVVVDVLVVISTLVSVFVLVETLDRWSVVDPSVFKGFVNASCVDTLAVVSIGVDLRDPGLRELVSFDVRFVLDKSTF